MEVSIAQALSDVSLYEGWLKVKENAGCAGVDGETIEQFGRRLFINLDTLRNEVHYGTYRPQPLLRVIIDEAGGKPRPLSIPTVRDRVLQSAVARTLTPVLEAEFEDCSFAYRQGRSVDMAVRRVMRYRDEGYRWVVDADIQSFFDEIDHAQLLALLSGLVSDLRLVRYADDFLVLCRDETKAQQALELTEEILAALKLRINEAKTRIVDFERGFRFLGVQFVRSLVVKKAGEVLREIPAIKVDQALVFGNAQITTPAMNFCLKEKIPIVLLSSAGRYYGVVDAFDTDPVLLHRDQFLQAEERRRRRVADALENHGVRVQRSVFECHLSLAELEVLTDELTALMDEAQDRLRCYSLCPQDYPRVAVDGRGRVTADPDYHVV